MIMTLFLWHLTAVTLVTSIAVALGDLGLAHGPGSADWWILRPVWLLLYVLLLMVLVTLFLRLEHTGGTEPTSVFRQVAGAVVVCVGLSLLALNGIGGDAHPAQVLLVISLPFLGAAVAGIKLMPHRGGQA
jgi:small-conductance mechanosensitive channel